MSDSLTIKDFEALRRPFGVLAVKFLPVGKIDKQGHASYLTYIDASLVIERLNEVDPGWSVSYTLPAGTVEDPLGIAVGLPVEAHLTVMGVTRTGVGQIAMGYDDKRPRLDDKHVKAAYSDAFKRAGLMFGVGAYLRNMGDNYRIPKSLSGKDLFWSYTKSGSEKLGGLNAAGKAQLRALYSRIVEHPEFVKRYGTPQSYGAVQVDESDDVEVVENSSDGRTMNDHEAEVIALVSSFNGKKTTKAALIAACNQKQFGKALPLAVNAVASNHKLKAIEVETIRAAAIDVAGDENDPLIDLHDLITEIIKATQ